MSVEFEDEQAYRSTQTQPAVRQSSFERFVISLGLAKSPKQAQLVLVAGACLMLLLSITIFYRGQSSDVTLTPDQRQSALDDLDRAALGQ